MTTCACCGKPIDIEFGPGREVFTIDGDFYCDSSCRETHFRRVMNDEPAPDPSESRPINGYDP